MSEFVRKITSRKLWMAVAMVAAGIYVVLGGDPAEMESSLVVVKTVVGSITALVGGVSYVVAEAKVDVARAGDAAVDVDLDDLVQDVIDGIGELKLVVANTDSGDAVDTAGEPGEANK